MAEYLVVWRINMDADTPREAAEAALASQRDHGSDAVVFDVWLADERTPWRLPPSSLEIDLSDSEPDFDECVRCGKRQDVHPDDDHPFSDEQDGGGEI